MIEKDHLGDWSPDLTLKMASAQVVETSVANNSPSQDSNHPDDLFQSRKDGLLKRTTSKSGHVQVPKRVTIIISTDDRANYHTQVSPFHIFRNPQRARGLFLKSPESFGPISGAIIPFISLQRRGSKPPNIAILLVFLTLKTS